MTLQEFFQRAQDFANARNCVQYVCRDTHGNLYLSNDPPFLEAIVVKAIPENMPVWPLLR